MDRRSPRRADASRRRGPPTGSARITAGKFVEASKGHLVVIYAAITLVGIGKVVTFLVMLSVLIVLHEFGHFLVARRNGVRVNEFAVGFGPKLFGLDQSREAARSTRCARCRSAAIARCRARTTSHRGRAAARASRR